MKLQERADCYQKAFPKFPGFIMVNDRAEMHALWVMGNNYHTSGYYGAYPAGYLKRIMSLFPDKKKVLHLFSGELEKFGTLEQYRINGIIHDTFDCTTEATIIGDAENLSAYVPMNHYDLILCDVPYSVEDAEHYGTPMISRQKVLREAHKVLELGGHLICLDQTFPLYSKEQWVWEIAIGMIKSTNHRVRAVFGWRKV